jgi:hypothetical protein
LVSISKPGEYLPKILLATSLVAAEDPLIASVVRMLITVHRQLNLFEALGVDTIFELGLISVEPTHKGRGEKKC